jgi:hypothetical protein
MITIVVNNGEARRSKTTDWNCHLGTENRVGEFSADQACEKCLSNPYLRKEIFPTKRQT